MSRHILRRNVKSGKETGEELEEKEPRKERI